MLFPNNRAKKNNLQEVAKPRKSEFAVNLTSYKINNLTWKIPNKNKIDHLQQLQVEESVDNNIQYSHLITSIVLYIYYNA